MIQIYGFQSGKPVKGQLVRAGKEGRVFFLSENGILYSTRYSKGCQMFTADKIATYLGANELKALRALGLMTTADIKAAHNRAKVEDQKHKRERWALQIVEAAKKLGVKLTREQLRKAKA